jgi:hypothetical protein
VSFVSYLYVYILTGYPVGGRVGGFRNTSWESIFRLFSNRFGKAAVNKELCVKKQMFRILYFRNSFASMYIWQMKTGLHLSEK